MNTVFSHIVQRRLSRESENVATEALVFILESSDAARGGLMNLLRAIEPDLPDLRFSAQKSTGSARPDMQGSDGNIPRVYIENKFWAGLTESQPVEYLRRLAKHGEPAVLLIVAPEARQETVWREMCRRLEAQPSPPFETPLPVAVYGMLRTALGPTLALTSWTSLLSEIETKIKDDPRGRNDLDQLRALCVSADSQAFIPLSAAELTDQRVPAFILEVRSVAEAAVQKCISEHVLSIRGLRPQADDKRMGRYIQFLSGSNPHAWIGIDLALWRRYGETPLWLAFLSRTGRPLAFQPLLERWAGGQGLPTARKNRGFPFALGIRPATGEEKDEVIRSVVQSLKEIAENLARSPAQ